MRIVVLAGSLPEVQPGEVLMAVDAGELALLSNAITEALEAVEEWEFQTRLGETREAAKALRARVKEALASTRT